jgi:type I restriction enzyme M protein
MTEQSSTIITKVWSMCGVLYDDGVSYGDYLEQLTYMIFLKMADEFSKPPYNKSLGIPEGYTWTDMNMLTGTDLEGQYKATLEKLGTKSGILGEIFQGAQNKISEAAKLARIVKMIDAERWTSMSADVKGEIYEGLLQKNAEDIKSGAGQFFTPRPLIRAMVECLRPEPMKTIVDPACGSGGFFLAAQRYIADNYPLDREQKEFLRNSTFRGWEIVRSTYRLSLMNLFLHNIGDIYGAVPITRNDALLADPGERFDYVLTNPPFGKKSSMTFTNEEGEQETEDLVYSREDFWATSSNKQLNFVQHINTLLKSTGKAAVVVPDNVLFEAGAGETVRKKLLETTDLHTILRLPTGIFYKPGVKANVMFFDKRPASPEKQTREVWIYDFRTNMHFTLKQHPMTRADLDDFVNCFNPENRHIRKETWTEENPDGRFRRYTVNEIFSRNNTSLDIFWIKDKSLTDLDSLPEPDILASDIIENLQSAMDSFKDLLESLSE